MNPIWYDGGKLRYGKGAMPLFDGLSAASFGYEFKSGRKSAYMC